MEIHAPFKNVSADGRTFYAEPADADAAPALAFFNHPDVAGEIDLAEAVKEEFAA